MSQSSTTTEDLNKVLLIGKVAESPQQFTTQGKKVFGINLIIQVRRKGDSRVDSIPVTSYGALAESIHSCVQKGDSVLFECAVRAHASRTPGTPAKIGLLLQKIIPVQ